MKVVIVGAQGFVGKNLCLFLEKEKGMNIIPVDRSTGYAEKVEALRNCDVVINLAGINRPANGDFSGNYTILGELITLASEAGTKPRLFHLSSTKVDDDNDYGKSKALAERTLEQSDRFTVQMIYRAPNLYGKWCKPNYNSYIATCIQNLHDGMEIDFQDNPITILYIDDLCEGIAAFIENGKVAAQEIFDRAELKTTVVSVVDKLQKFKNGSSIFLPDIADPHDKKLYATFLSAMPRDKFVQTYKSIEDERGAFSEIFRDLSGGQISINKTVGDCVKGNHWHNTKCEKFVPLVGSIIVRFKHMITREVFEFKIDANENQVIDIPPGYAHSIQNTDESATTITLIWANEEFDHDRPDTFREEMR